MPLVGLTIPNRVTILRFKGGSTPLRRLGARLDCEHTLD